MKFFWRAAQKVFRNIHLMVFVSGGVRPELDCSALSVYRIPAHGSQNMAFSVCDYDYLGHLSKTSPGERVAGWLASGVSEQEPISGLATIQVDLMIRTH
jgi:hypothetical protein